MSNRKSRRQKMMPVLPNLFTTGNLTFGLLSIITSIQIIAAIAGGTESDEWLFRKCWWAGAFLVIAAFLDMLDGKLARFIKHESAFGLSYDSLCDLISFGVAPAVLIYTWVLMGSGKLGIMAIFIYTVCAALRLARFNVQQSSVERLSFMGLSSPTGAGLMISPILLLSALEIMPDQRVVWFYLIAAPVIGLLMVSNVRYWKRLSFKIAGPFNALVIAAIVIAAGITMPEIMFIFIVYLYATAGLVVHIVRHLRRGDLVTEEAKARD